MSKSSKISIKRAYEPYEKMDGYRVLVDRLWPRGLKKEDAQLDEWVKEIAPSKELRQWFGHKEERFKEFKERYEKELKAKKEELKRLHDLAENVHLTLLYAAKDEKYNNALVLKDVLTKMK